MASVMVTQPMAAGQGPRSAEEAAPGSMQRQRPESPTRNSSGGRAGPARTSSGKFEDPMLAWRSSQSDGALCSPGGSASAAPAISPTSSAKQPGIAATPSKHVAFRETVLDTLASGHSPTGSTPQAGLMSPIRSQSPNTRSGGGRSGGSGSVGSSVSPSASLFDKLRLPGNRGLIGSATSDGGSRSSPHSRSLQVSGVEDLSVSATERSNSCNSSPTRASPRASPLASPAAGTQLQFPPSVSPRVRFGVTSPEEAAAAAIAAVDRGERDRSSACSAADVATARSVMKMKSIGTRSMGGRALTVSASWRSSGALNLSSAAAGAMPAEGGLQSQTHEALQQLLGMNASVDSASIKRFSAPGQPPVGPSVAHQSMLGRRISHQHLVTHTEEAGEEGSEQGAATANYLMTQPPRARRFTRSLTEKKLDVRLDLSAAVELSYADLDTAGEDGDDNDDVF